MSSAAAAAAAAAASSSSSSSSSSSVWKEARSNYYREREEGGSTGRGRCFQHLSLNIIVPLSEKNWSERHVHPVRFFFFFFFASLGQRGKCHSKMPSSFSSPPTSSVHLDWSPGQCSNPTHFFSRQKSLLKAVELTNYSTRWLTHTNCCVRDKGTKC